jgi:hypothetical protein
VRKSMWRWVLTGALALALATAAPLAAAAAPTALPTDPALKPGTFTQYGNGSLGPYGDQAQMTFYIHNYGPNDLLPMTWWLEYIAPPGTEFHTGSFGSCQEIVAHRDYKCGQGGEIFVDPASSEGTCCNPATVKLTIVGPVTGPGKVKLTYSADTNTGNNVATIPASAHPVSGSTTAPPTKKPAATPAATPRANKPVASPTPATTPAAPIAASDTLSPSASGSPEVPSTGSPIAIDLVGGRASSSAALPWIVAVGVLAVAGFGIAVWMGGRRPLP